MLLRLPTLVAHKRSRTSRVVVLARVGGSLVSMAESVKPDSTAQHQWLRMPQVVLTLKWSRALVVMKLGCSRASEISMSGEFAPSTRISLYAIQNESKATCLYLRQTGGAMNDLTSIFV
ncbi:hypothetical protein EV702DRAFT_1270875 [Suillus placidus]|uniref:Uncharacterized protein n=1 Tax=Suillus placidus TaxID=48579 RepID=A0A9P6ZLR0_9AGAM|nr:hypothetical protein EV702DRAFT_1270875 [Suillus placidus]